MSADRRDEVDAARPCMIVAHGDPLFAASLSRSFRRVGWDVYQARTGPEARRLARMLGPDLLILAADLDEESGWLTCDKLSNELLHAKIFLVADTSNPQNGRYADFVGAAGVIDPRHNLQTIVQEVCGHTVHAAG